MSKEGILGGNNSKNSDSVSQQLLKKSIIAMTFLKCVVPLEMEAIVSDERSEDFIISIIRC